MSDLVVQNGNVPDFLLAAAGGATGLESMDDQCISMPFLKLVQALTDGVGEVEGLSAGNFYCKALSKNFGKTVKVIPLKFYRVFTEWSGEGREAKLVNTYTVADFKAIENQITKDENGKMKLSNGNRVVDTRNYLVLNADSVDDGIMLISFQSSAIPASRSWNTALMNTRAGGKTLPMYSKIWQLSAALEKGDKGTYYKMLAPTDCGFIGVNIAQVVQSAFNGVQEISESEIKAADSHDGDSIPF